MAICIRCNTMFNKQNKRGKICPECKQKSERKKPSWRNYLRDKNETKTKN